jgi:hypothetical protein
MATRKKVIATQVTGVASTAEPSGRPKGNLSDSDYAAFVRHLDDKFQVVTSAANVPLFTTSSADGLFAHYLRAFEDRQYHNCSACREFIRRYGCLVTLTRTGEATSAIWHPEVAPEPYYDAILNMKQLVEAASVTGAFYSRERIWGTPVTGIWTHYAVHPPASLVGDGTIEVLTASQKRAEVYQNHLMLAESITAYKLRHVVRAVALLESDALYRSEKVLGIATWFLDVLQRWSNAPAYRKDNILWYEAATAPAGFCHVRSSVIGTLLDDIATGMPFEMLKQRFDAKMSPVQYQRPQAAPSAGAIAQAEVLVERLGVEAAFRRRYATSDEIEAFWRPPVQRQQRVTTGLFVDLYSRTTHVNNTDKLHLPPTTTTWVKFCNTVLPRAISIELFNNGTDNYAAITTAVDPNAPPILQWDHVDQRNPFAWYVWVGGSTPRSWGLKDKQYSRVIAITTKPCLWLSPGVGNQSEGVILILEGARETRTDTGMALFPEQLRSELHSIRDVVERYSQTHHLEGRDSLEALACGYGIFRGPEGATTNKPVQLRVQSKDQERVITIDRWD